MPDFAPYTFDLAGCRQQVQELKDLLDSSPDLGEAVFHDFFESRSHLRALIGAYNESVLSADTSLEAIRVQHAIYRCMPPE
jgi:hypothetical protein